MDEKTIILEQERLAREKKKRKNRRKKQILGLAVLLLGGAVIWYVFRGRNIRPQAEQTKVEVTAQPGQEILYTNLTSVRGNEIQYTKRISDGSSARDGKMPEDAETCTALIPVGTQVITRLGTAVTFSRLAAGDHVALIMEESGGESVIVKVYITE